MNRAINLLLWAIYLALLGVLLPHTAWAFGVFEPGTGPTVAGIPLIAWLAAFAFEASIAALTYKLIARIEAAPKYKKTWKRVRYTYLNVYAGGLLVSVAVSALANWSHAVEFGTITAVVRQFPMLAWFLPVAFGAILPGVSFLFAHVLADVAAAELETDPELDRAKATITDLRRTLREAEGRITDAESRAIDAETRFAAAGDLFARLMAESKRDRILAAAERWPTLPAASIAVIADASQSYVSEILNG